MTQAPARIDPLTFGVIWSGLISIAEESGITLRRTAYSEAVREGRDFSAALFDTQGRMIAQGDFSPGHLGSMPFALEHVLAAHPADTLRPGDVIVLNDLYMGSGHLPDFFCVTPLFHREQLVGFGVNVAHMIDVGGAAPGSQAVEGIFDHYQEGLRILPTKVWQAGVANEGVLGLIASNVRIPEKVLGDLRAQRNANRVAEQRLGELVERYGSETIFATMDEIIRHSEAEMRAAIRAIPDGVYGAEDYYDDYGRDTEPLKIKVTVTVAGDEISVDFTGSSPQTPSGINALINYTRAYSYFTVKCFTVQNDLPQNAGCVRPIKVVAPEGSLFNPRRPAGGGARAIMQQRIVDTVLAAIAPAAPNKVIAASSHWANPIYGGVDPRTGRRFVFYEIIVGGYGARSTKDGAEALAGSFNLENIPCEINEAHYPIVVERLEFIRDSAGAGRFRGGCGIRKDVRLLGHDLTISNLAERYKFPPPGLAGGKPGGLGATIVNPGKDERALASKGKYRLETGDLVSIRLSGGGGYGDPLEREPEQVRLDVVRGYVSRERARELYGVALTDDLFVDAAATARLRQR
ncbi:MAG: hydantoinase B/oxoprolinase family protein [Chloroflexi bacterium]|nr:hydantoinase B/oxoprolinase family protein [Chloroflexota bacterium]